jgi:hypothetical protein
MVTIHVKVDGTTQVVSHSLSTAGLTGNGAEIFTLKPTTKANNRSIDSILHSTIIHQLLSMIVTSRMPGLLLVVLRFGLAKNYTIRLNRSMPSLGLVSVCAHVDAVVSTSEELVEDVESIGHAPGMLLLSGSRLCRELSVLRELWKESPKT